MSADLLAKAVAAHGGLDRWNQYASVRAAVSIGGALWAAKGRPGVLADVSVEARLHEQRVTTHLNGQGLRHSFAPGRVAVEDEDGRVVSERAEPRAAFRGHTAETPWDELHVAYFSGYALWKCRTQTITKASVRLEPGGRASYAGGGPQIACSGQTYHVYTYMRPAPDIATALYHTGIDPFTGQEVYVAKGLRDRKMQRALMQCFKPENYFMVREALLKAGRGDLIGNGCDCLIPAHSPKAAIEARRRRAYKVGEGDHYHSLANPAKGEPVGERGLPNPGYRPGRRTARRQDKTPKRNGGRGPRP